MKENNSLKKKQGYPMLIGMVIGASIGAAGFAFTGNIITLPLCASVGMLLGMTFSSITKKSKEEKKNGI